MSGASPAVVAFVLAIAVSAILAMLSTMMMPDAYDYGGRPVEITTTVGFAAAFADWLGYLTANASLRPREGQATDGIRPVDLDTLTRGG
ncbi:MAG TPA: hypothetical protein VIQ02_03205 [Jiangellaceae bacterium]